MTDIPSFTFVGANPGAKIVVSGAVHGDEKCGTKAINRILEEFDRGELRLACGSATFIPICNRPAYDADVRWIDNNFNRYLVPKKNPRNAEERLQNEMCGLLEREFSGHQGDKYLLDLHSFHAGVGSFCYVGTPGSSEHDFANALGVADAGVTGWSYAYAASGKQKVVAADPDESVGMTEYARRFGAIAATLECGEHRSPEAPETAYRAIRGALAHLGMLEPLADAKPKLLEIIYLKNVIYREGSEVFVHAWMEMDPLKKGDLIATSKDGKRLIAPDDGFMVLPNAHAPAGAEFYYFGQKIPNPPLSANPTNAAGIIAHPAV